MSSSRNTHPGMPAVAVLLAARITELAPELVGAQPTSRGRTEWRFRSRGSLSVAVAGTNRGSFYDHESGVGGDSLGLVSHLQHLPMAAAWRWALGWLGIREGQPLPATLPRPAAGTVKAPAPDSTPLARRIWHEAVAADAPDSVVPAYLASRGLMLEPGAALRFHPWCWRNSENGPRGPAMVAAMTNPTTGAWVGTHVTYLRPDGGGKAEGRAAKIMLGHAGVVRLTPDAEVTMGLGIAEGLETALSVAQHFGWRPVWSAASAGMIAGLPVLPGIQALTVFADQDRPRRHGHDGHTGPDMPRGAGLHAATVCAERWHGAGCEVQIIAPPTVGTDFADLAQEGAA